MRSILVDTGQLYAQFDTSDALYPKAQRNAVYLEQARAIVVPWPVIYETLWSGFVRKQEALIRFEAYIKQPRVVFADDLPYRDRALELALDTSLRRARPLSVVDCTIRLMLDDVDLRIDGLMTFNPRDFHDVCRRRQIELISE